MKLPRHELGLRSATRAPPPGERSGAVARGTTCSTRPRFRAKRERSARRAISIPANVEWRRREVAHTLPAWEHRNRERFVPTRENRNGHLCMAHLSRRIPGNPVAFDDGKVQRNCGLTAFSGKPIVTENGKDLLACQRAKVGRSKLADFFVPLVGSRSCEV